MIDSGKLNWSGILPLNADSQHIVPDTPGVYRMCIVDAQGTEVPILRQGGAWDKNGIMYIGGTTRSGTLRGGFGKQRGAHADGMRGKRERNGGEEQVLVQLWRDIRAVHPNASLTFQYATLNDHLTSKIMQQSLLAEYEVKFGEKALSGKASLLHNPRHPWREHLTNKAQER